MPWAKLDDRFWTNRKVRQSGHSIAVWTLCLTWSSDELTDGDIPADELPFICSGIKHPEKDAEVLVSTGMFEASDTGWRIPDYLEFNPSRDEILTNREKDRERKSKAGRKGGQKDSARNPSGGQKDSARNPDGVQRESKRSPQAPSRPVPSPRDNPPNPPPTEGGTQHEAEQPLELHCPRATCDQPPGQPCLDRTGNPRPPHSIRCTERIFARIIADDSSPLDAIDTPNGSALCECADCDGLGFVFVADDTVDFCPNRYPHPTT